MSEHFGDTGDTDADPQYAWPIFMIAQTHILGKNYRLLRATLENPEIDGAKAFEAMVQIAILLRLMSGQQHRLAPFHPTCIGNDTPDSRRLDGTEMFHVEDSVEALPDLILEVQAQYCDNPRVVQVVAVPLFASFPVYDFFLLHRGNGDEWRVVDRESKCRSLARCPNICLD